MNFRYNSLKPRVFLKLAQNIGEALEYTHRIGTFHG